MILLEYEFNTLEELYNRVKPALHSKKIEFIRLGYSNINEIDVFNLKDEDKVSLKELFKLPFDIKKE